MLAPVAHDDDAPPTCPSCREDALALSDEKRYTTARTWRYRCASCGVSFSIVLMPD